MIKNKALLSLSLLFFTTSIIPKQAAHIPQQKHPKKNIQQKKATHKPRLSQYPFGAGSVLPVFTDQSNKTYVILSREAHGRDRSTYDDFGGKRDKGENHPLVTASREFFEESIIELTIGLSLDDIRAYIDIAKADNTQYIIANEKNVMYIVDFGAYADKFFDNFYTAFATTTDPHSKEKDSIAVVEWDTLQKAITQSQFNTGIKVQAFVLDKSGQRWDIQDIPLRPFFPKKIRPFFMNQPYQEGLSKKIRLYDMPGKIPTTVTPPTQPKKIIGKAKTIKAGSRKSWRSSFWNWMSHSS